MSRKYPARTKTPNEDRVRKCREAALKRWAKPEFRQKMDEITSSPEYREKMSESCTAAFADENLRSKRSENGLALWNTEDYRQSVLDGLAASKTLENQEKRTLGVQKSWDANPDRRAEQSLMMKEEWHKKKSKS